MKKGQEGLLTILIIAVLILSAFLITQISTSKTKDDIILLPTINKTINITEQTSKNQCLIESPFYCRIWSVSSEFKELTIQLSNSRNDDFLVQEIEISGCERIRKDLVYLDRGTSITLKYNCSFHDNQPFLNNFSVEYKRTRGSQKLFSSGNISLFPHVQ